MSVSDDHELMVLHLICWLDNGEGPFRPKILNAECSLYSKVCGLPPTLDQHRPDLFATSIARELPYLVGEVKTTKDLETSRTETQLRAFVRYLEGVRGGYIVLGVPWSSVTSARSLLRYVIAGEQSTFVKPLVVDCSPILFRSERK